MVPITFTLTSCGRPDLLDITLASFVEHNTCPIPCWIISEDSGDPGILQEVRDIVDKHLGDKIGISYRVIGGPKVGQRKRLDQMFKMVDTDYIFHCEDDWEFDSSGFIESSLAIMALQPDVNQVWVRHQDDTPHKCLDDMTMDPNFMGIWNGYSWNPGLRRKWDYDRMFPDGVSAFEDEAACAIYTRKFNYKAVSLRNTACRHIGYGRHITNE